MAIGVPRESRTPPPPVPARRGRLLRSAMGAFTVLAVAIGISITAMPGAQAAPAVPTFNSPPEGYASYVGQSTCDPDPKAGVVDFRNLLLATYPTTSSLGISRDCSVGGQSEHKEGRAFDWGVSASTQGQIASDLLNWLLARDGQTAYSTSLTGTGTRTPCCAGSESCT